MQHDKTKEKTPSLTFMPRAMEFESYTDEELWRVADPDETYLDPPAPPFTKEQLKKEKKEARQKRLQERKDKAEGKLNSDNAEEKGNDTDSIYSSDSEFDEEYQNKLRTAYNSRQPYMRDRDFARKYSLSTMDLVYRYISKIPTNELCQDDSVIPALLTRLSFDDVWQLLAELRLMQDHIDTDLGADLHNHLLEAAGTMTRQNVAWIRSTLQELSEWNDHINKSRHILNLPEELEDEMLELKNDLRSLQSRSEQTLNLLVASTGIAQSALVINQTSGINKLTELAFFFIPLSFITAIFSMQVVEFTESPPKMWTWGLSLGIAFFVTYLIRCFLRSPSVRLHAMGARVTILNRFTPPSRYASRRLNSVSNRAIAKYLLFFISLCTVLIIFVSILLTLMFLVHFGLWAGGAGTALYFIITRWPEPAVLAPCFVALFLSAVGFWATWRWSVEMEVFWEKWSMAAADMLGRQWPEKWKMDRVEDEDLAQEGIKTYARQAIFFAST
jgi:Mg2+ and Co2+ transporter CorA